MWETSRELVRSKSPERRKQTGERAGSSFNFFLQEIRLFVFHEIWLFCSYLRDMARPQSTSRFNFRARKMLPGKSFSLHRTKNKNHSSVTPLTHLLHILILFTSSSHLPSSSFSPPTLASTLSDPTSHSQIRSIPKWQT